MRVPLGVEVEESMKDEVNKAVSRRNERNPHPKNTRTSFTEEALAKLLASDDEV